jgi:hypothetical protein
MIVFLPVIIEYAMDNYNHHSQKTRISTTSIAIIAMVAVLPISSFVYAQPTTTTNTTTPQESNTTATATVPTAPLQLITPSAAAQQIINNTKAQCEQAHFLQKKCVTLIYESPTTVVLSGLVSIYGGGPESKGLYPNPFLWSAVDGFKAQGYTMTHVEMIMGGNRSGDEEFNVVMSK